MKVLLNFLKTSSHFLFTKKSANMEILNLLKFITQYLSSKRIKYMLGGSMAMNFYAVSRATRDIDIVIHLTESDIPNFMSGLDQFYYNSETIAREVKREGMFNIIDNDSGFKIDLMVLKNTEYTTLAFDRRQTYSDFGFDICVTSLEDLIIAKLQWIQTLYSDR